MALSKLLLVLLLTAPPDPVTVVRDRARTAAKIMRDGDAQMRAGNVKAACRDYQRASTELPSWWMPRLALARCGRFIGLKPETLVMHAEFAVKARPEIHVAHLALGRALEEVSRIDDAVKAYSGALKRYPGLTEAHYRIGRLLVGLKQHKKARWHLQMAMNQQPKHVNALEQLIRSNQALGLRFETEQTLRTMVRVSRYPARALSRLIRFYESEGMSKKATQARKRYKKRFL